jgi:hypothetical protein
MNTRKGQNLVEYILLAVAVILVFLVILKPNSGILSNSVNRTLNTSLNLINSMGQSITISP